MSLSQSGVESESPGCRMSVVRTALVQGTQPWYHSLPPGALPISTCEYLLPDLGTQFPHGPWTRSIMPMSISSFVFSSTTCHRSHLCAHVQANSPPPPASFTYLQQPQPHGCLFPRSTFPLLYVADFTLQCLTPPRPFTLNGFALINLLYSMRSSLRCQMCRKVFHSLSMFLLSSSLSVTGVHNRSLRKERGLMSSLC